MGTFDGGKRTRHRYEHSHLTIGQWACAIMGAHMEIVVKEDDSPASLKVNESIPYPKNCYHFMKGEIIGAKLWIQVDRTKIWIIMNYFDQFLAWFGACTMQGCMVDLVAEIP